MVLGETRPKARRSVGHDDEEEEDGDDDVINSTIAFKPLPNTELY